MSNPLFIAVALLALAVLILGIGLILQWRRRPATTQSNSDSWVRVEQPKPAQEPLTQVAQQAAQEPITRPRIRERASSEAPAAGPAPAEAPAADIERRAREGLVHMLGDVERTLKQSLQGEVESSLRQLRSVGQEVTEAGNETLRTAARALANLDGDIEALRAKLAKTGEIATAQVQREAERATANLRGQEKRASEKLSRKATRRDRRERFDPQAQPPQAVPVEREAWPPQAVPEEIATAEHAFAAVQIGEALAAICTEAERQRGQLAKQTAETEGRLNKSMEELVRAAIGKVRDEVEAAVADAEQKAKAHFAGELARNEAEKESRAMNGEIEKAREHRDRTVRELEKQIQQAEARAEATMMHATVIEHIAKMSPEPAKRGPGNRDRVAEKGAPGMNGHPSNGQPAAPADRPVRSSD